jgi:proteasome lid subunit RPN8/RPN11
MTDMGRQEIKKKIESVDHDLFHRHNEHIDEHWEEEHPIWTWTKRVLLLFVAVFLFYLMFTYMGIGPDVLKVFEGQAASHEIGGNFTLFIDKETKVVFSEELYLSLFDMFVNNQGHEFKACLYGTLETLNSGLVIYSLNDVVIPEIYEQDVYHVVSAGCDSETLVSMHSHPYKKCLFSAQDVRSYQEFLEDAPHALMAIMCEEDRFAFEKG